MSRAKYVFTFVGTSGGITTYAAVGSNGQTTTLSFNGTLFTEYFANGTQFVYKYVTGSGNPTTYSLYLVQDARGVAQTYSYDSTGLFQNITVPGGRLVSFLYGSGSPTSLLSSVQDWSGRVWTLQYDSNRNLTTMMAPLGCTTQYTYSLAGTTSTLMLYTIEDPQRYTTSYLYDNMGRVTTMTPGTAVWSWTYSDNGVQKRLVMMEPFRIMLRRPRRFPCRYIGRGRCPCPTVRRGCVHSVGWMLCRPPMQLGTMPRRPPMGSVLVHQQGTAYNKMYTILSDR